MFYPQLIEGHFRKVTMAGCSVSYHSSLILVLVLLILFHASLQQDTIFSFSSPAEIINTTDGRIRGVTNRLHKDFVIGGLFPVHTAVDGGGNCGAVRLERGVERVEAMLYAIDVINANDNLLKGLTLGYDIRDTCSSETIGLDETVDLVVTKAQLDSEDCQDRSLTAVNISALEEDFREAPVSGIIGAAASRVSVPVASLVRLFMTPQVSYASTSAILSNRDRYGYFYRTTPPDSLQARAMADLLLFFNWTHISTIFSKNTYGQPGIDELHTLAGQRGICIDLNEGIDDDFSDENFATLAEKLHISVANVVILFASQDSADQLLKHLYQISSRKFIWIASDSWARSLSVVSKYSTMLTGMIGFVPLTEHLPSFHDYFSRLTLNSNNRNPWFEEFYSTVMNCTTDSNSNKKEPCKRNSSVPDLSTYEQGNKIPLVVDAVYTFAHALQNFLMENCEQPVQWFPNNRTCQNQMRELNGSALLEYIKKLDFISETGNRVIFDDEGNVEGTYDILNYQAMYVDEESGVKKTTFIFRSVGIWNSSVTNKPNLKALKLSSMNPFQFGLGNVGDGVLTSPPISQCGKCSRGQYRRQVLSCCGFCDPCLGELFSNDPQASNCSKCENESWGNNPMNGSDGCVHLKVSFLSFSHPYSIIIIIIALSGLILVTSTLVVFVKYWNTPVVKSSGREQMILLLMGIALSFISAFFYVSTPLDAICGIQKWLLWTSFSLMFGALLVKIIRVARIFLQKLDIKRPRFTEPYYQVLFTIILVLVQLIILVISTSIDHPQVMRETRRNSESPNAFPTVVITCMQERTVFLILSIGYETVLIGLCTILGALSFTYPDNFNEAKYVALCTICIIVIWAAFIITFFATQSVQELQSIAISLAVVMSGYAVLFTIFGQKLFIILFRPSQNQSRSTHVNTDSISTTSREPFSK